MAKMIVCSGLFRPSPYEPEALAVVPINLTCKLGEHAVEVGSQVGLLCAQLSRWPSLHDLIREAGAGAELDRLLVSLRDAIAPEPQLISQWMDAIEDACARKGLAGITTRDHAYWPLPPGMSAAAEPPQAWVCPIGRCDRVTLPEEAPQVPTCAIAGGKPMAAFGMPA